MTVWPFDPRAPETLKFMFERPGFDLALVPGDNRYSWLAYALGGFSNFFLRRPFVSDAVLAVVAMVTVAFVVINCFNQHGKAQEFAHGVDWNVVPAGILILFALWILAGLAIACSTRLDMIPTLAICSALFLLGLMSDYLFGKRAEA